MYGHWSHQPNTFPNLSQMFQDYMKTMQVQYHQLYQWHTHSYLEYQYNVLYVQIILCHNLKGFFIISKYFDHHYNSRVFPFIHFNMGYKFDECQ